MTTGEQDNNVLLFVRELIKRRCEFAIFWYSGGNEARIEIKTKEWEFTTYVDFLSWLRDSGYQVPHFSADEIYVVVDDWSKAQKSRLKA